MKPLNVKLENIDFNKKLITVITTSDEIKISSNKLIIVDEESYGWAISLLRRFNKYDNLANDDKTKFLSEVKDCLKNIDKNED